MSDDGMAPQESPTPRDPAQRERTPMDTTESSSPHAHPSTEDHDDSAEAHYACLERPTPAWTAGCSLVALSSPSTTLMARSSSTSACRAGAARIASSPTPISHGTTTSEGPTSLDQRFRSWVDPALQSLLRGGEECRSKRPPRPSRCSRRREDVSCRAGNSLSRYPARDLRTTARPASAWRRTAGAARKVAPGSAYTLSARTTYRTNQLGPGVQ
jgi:hypothetical protein